MLTRIFRLCLPMLGLLLLVTSGRPRTVLSRADMVEVLYDIHLTEALTDASTTPIPEDWTKGLSPSDFRELSFQSVLQKHELSEETFYNSVAWYGKHLRLYNKVYEEVDKRLKQYILDINDWKYHKPVGLERIFEHVDTLRIRVLFDRLLVQSDTLEAGSLAWPTDSMSGYVETKARLWLPEITLDSLSLICVPIDSISVDSISVDSVLVDSLAVDTLTVVRLPADRPRVATEARRIHPDKLHITTVPAP